VPAAVSARAKSTIPVRSETEISAAAALSGNAGLFARRLTNARRGLSVLVLSDKAEPAFPYAHQTVARSLSIAELLERLKTLATRKGRPRKGFSRKTSVPNQPKATTDGH